LQKEFDVEKKRNIFNINVYCFLK